MESQTTPKSVCQPLPVPVWEPERRMESVRPHVCVSVYKMKKTMVEWCDGILDEIIQRSVSVLARGPQMSRRSQSLRPIAFRNQSDSPVRRR